MDLGDESRDTSGVTTWIEAYDLTRKAMADQNGVAAPGVPRVTNEQAASILRYSMHTAERLKLPAELTARWYELSLALAGWRQPGDKFLVTETHRRAKFPDGATPLLWQTALNVAQVAQTRGAAFVAPTVNPPDDYDLVLRKAWAKMLADRARSSPPDVRTSDASDGPVTVPVTVPDSLPLPPATPAGASTGGGGGLLLLALLYFVNRGRI